MIPLSPSSYRIVPAHTVANPSTRYLTITHIRTPVPVPTSELPAKWIILDPYLQVLETLLSYVLLPPACLSDRTIEREAVFPDRDVQRRTYALFSTSLALSAHLAERRIT